MEGKLYGVGVGPGDPELLTLKAVRIINECDVIAIPGLTKEKCVAYKIAKGAIDNIDEKEFIYIHMPMTKDKEILNKSHDEGAETIINELKKGKKVGFLTLGDPSVYSTYLYVHKRVLALGHDAEIISGITSFCAAAAKINKGLVEGREELHIIPASYQIDEALTMPGTKVLMKSGKKIEDVKNKIIDKNLKAVMIENCGMEGERIHHDVNCFPHDGSYYSLIIVKENKND